MKKIISVTNNTNIDVCEVDPKIELHNLTPRLSSVLNLFIDIDELDHCSKAITKLRQVIDFCEQSFDKRCQFFLINPSDIKDHSPLKFPSTYYPPSSIVLIKFEEDYMKNMFLLRWQTENGA